MNEWSTLGNLKTNNTNDLRRINSRTYLCGDVLTMVVMVKQRWLFAAVALITVSFLVFHFHHWNLLSKSSPHKLVFVDESCHRENDLDEARPYNIWAKLRLLNGAFHLAKAYKRTLLVISCTTATRNNPQPMATPICQMFSDDPNLVCRTLNPDQVNKHIDQCMSWGDEKLAIMLDRKSTYKRRVYLCESRVSKDPSNLIRQQELAVSERFLEINVTDSHLQRVVRDVWNTVDGMGSIDWPQKSMYLLSDSDTIVNKARAVSVRFSPDSNILAIYDGPKQVQFAPSSFETHRSVAILYAALSSRWLWISPQAANSTALFETFLMIDELRRRQGKTYCTSFLRQKFQSPSSAVWTPYEQWCYDHFHSYFQPLPFSFDVGGPVTMYPQIHSHQTLSTPVESSSSATYPTSQLVDEGYQLYLLLRLRFETRPFFRYLVFLTTGIVLTVLLVVSKLWSYLTMLRRSGDYHPHGVHPRRLNGSIK